MTDVSCRVCEPVLDAVERHGGSAAMLVEGLPFGLADLRDPAGFIPWDPYTQLLERAADRLGGVEGIEFLGWQHASTQSAAVVRAVAIPLANPRPLYQLGARWYGHSLFQCTHAYCEDLPDGRLGQTIAIDEGRRDSPEFFAMMRGCLRGTPGLIGLPDARVEMHRRPLRADYTITPPAPLSWRAWMRRVLRRTAAPPEDALEELSFQQARLEEALRQAHDAGRQLEQAQRMEAVGTLASGITHDLNNILTAIRGFAELATDSLPDEHPARADLDAIVQEQERASATIQQLLAFGRRQEASDERVELGELAGKTARMLQPLVGAGRELVTRIDPRPCTVAGDRGQLEQVLVNLVVNACDAMPKGGRVTIETEAGPDCVCLSVRDTGSGMDEKTLGRIFEPFFTTKPRGKGTGLGLAAAFGIVKGNGGTIDVESAPGGGSLFVVRLPFAPKDSEPGLSG